MGPLTTGSLVTGVVLVVAVLVLGVWSFTAGGVSPRLGLPMPVLGVALLVFAGYVALVMYRRGYRR